MLEDRWEISLLNIGYIFYVLKHKEGISAFLFMGVKQLLGSALKNVKKIDKKQAIKKLAFLPPWQTHCGHCCIYIYICVCVCVCVCVCGQGVAAACEWLQTQLQQNILTIIQNLQYTEDRSSVYKYICLVKIIDKVII